MAPVCPSLSVPDQQYIGPGKAEAGPRSGRAGPGQTEDMSEARPCPRTSDYVLGPRTRSTESSDIGLLSSVLELVLRWPRPLAFGLRPYI